MQDSLQGKLTQEEMESMLEINPKLELVTKKIGFDLSRHSYSSIGSTCLPACFAMALCYWQEHLPMLNITTSRDYWEDYITKCVSGTIKGVSLSKLRMNLPQGFRKFIIKELTVKSFSDLIPPFYAWKFPLIQIVLYDKIFTIKERTGGTHAAIISQVNMQEKSLLLIDPNHSNPDKIIIETHSHMRDFAKGWKLSSNSVLLIYPKILSISFNIETGKAMVTKKFKQENIYKYI